MTREKINRGKRVVETGGNVSFVYTREQLEEIENTDTEHTLAFKKALALHRYFKETDELKREERKKKLEKYAKFQTLKLQILNKKAKPKKATILVEWTISGKQRFIQKEKVQGEFEAKLPNTDYRITITTNKLLFFKKKTIIDITLNKNISKAI